MSERYERNGRIQRFLMLMGEEEGVCASSMGISR